MPGKGNSPSLTSPVDPDDDSDKIPNEKDTSKPQYKADFPFLVDLVDKNGKCVYLALEDKEIITAGDYTEPDGTKYFPPKYEKVLWALPRLKKVQSAYKELTEPGRGKANTRKLFRDIVMYLKGVSKLPTEAHYTLLAAWAMHTYLLDKFHYSPIVWLYAVPERGKSRTGKGLIFISYRGLCVESVRESFLIRASGNYKSSLFLDVVDVTKKLEAAGSDDIIMSRYEKGLTVTRVNQYDKGPFEDTSQYEVFGATVIGSNEGLSPAMETRAIQINMPATTKNFETPVTKEAGLEIRERLVAFRAKYLAEEIPDCPKPAKGRLGDILKPLLQIIRLVDPASESGFLELTESLAASRQVEKSISFEARLIASLVALEPKIQSGMLPVEKVTALINADVLDARYKISPHKIGRTLSSLGFSKGKSATGGASIMYDKSLIDKLSAQYGVSQEIQDKPGKKVARHNNTDVSDDTDLLPDQTRVSPKVRSKRRLLRLRLSS
jgi:hypothetical protein